MRAHPQFGKYRSLCALSLFTMILLVGCAGSGSPNPTQTPIPSATAQQPPAITATPFVPLSPATPTAAGTSGVPSVTNATSPPTTVAIPSPAPSATMAAFDPEQLYAQVSPAVVTVTNKQRQARSTTPTMVNAGSGTIYDTKGDIITNRHVIDGAESIDITLQSGKTVPGVLIGQDPVADIAVVRIPAGDAPGVATFGDSRQVRPGQHVVAVGTPQGFDGSVAHGIVSGIDRPVGSLEGTIQTDVAISPGNSGGPIVNANGEVIGIVAAVLRGSEQAEKLSFAVPSNLAKRLADTIVADGKVTRPYLGVVTELLTPARADELGAKIPRGAYVSDVTAGTPGAQAGLAKGDVIVKVGDTVIDRATPLSIVLLDLKPGETVTLTVNRGGTEQSIPVTLVERPAALDP
jgi:serine protease Do